MLDILYIVTDGYKANKHEDRHHKQTLTSPATHPIHLPSVLRGFPKPSADALTSGTKPTKPRGIAGPAAQIAQRLRSSRAESATTPNRARAGQGAKPPLHARARPTVPYASLKARKARRWRCCAGKAKSGGWRYRWPVARGWWPEPPPANFLRLRAFWRGDRCGRIWRCAPSEPKRRTFER